MSRQNWISESHFDKIWFQHHILTKFDFSITFWQNLISASHFDKIWFQHHILTKFDFSITFWQNFISASHFDKIWFQHHILTKFDFSITKCDTLTYSPTNQIILLKYTTDNNLWKFTSSEKMYIQLYMCE